MSKLSVFSEFCLFVFLAYVFKASCITTKLRSKDIIDKPNIQKLTFEGSSLVCRVPPLEGFMAAETAQLPGDNSFKTWPHENSSDSNHNSVENTMDN